MVNGWSDVDALLKAYRNDLTQKATQFQNFAAQTPAPIPPPQRSLSTPIQWDNGAERNPAVSNAGGPSVINRIFDVLGRPGYAVSEATRQAVSGNEGDMPDIGKILVGAWNGFAGYKKTGMADVLNQVQANQDLQDAQHSADPSAVINASRFADSLKDPTRTSDEILKPDKGKGDVATAVAGFIGDVASDPLNYVGGTLFKGISEGTRGISRLLTGAEDLKKIEMPAEIAYQAPNTRPFNSPTNPINAPNAPAVPNSFFQGQDTNPLAKAFSTSAYNKTLRPEVLSSVQGAKARAVSRANILNGVARNFTPDEQRQAFKIAQGLHPASHIPEIDDLSMDLERGIDDLIKSSDLQNYAQLARNGIRGSQDGMIDSLNEQLRMMGEKFQFSKKVINPVTNTQVDLSRGNNWIKSWRYHDTSDPLVFTSKLSHAVENVTAKNQFLDEFAQRFGSDVPVADRGINAVTGKATLAHNAGIRDPRLQGLYFDKTIAKEMNHVLKNWDQISNPKSPFIKLLDESTRLWKTGVTIYAPSHHIRNVIGDTYFNWMDGVNTLKPYRVAAKTMATQRNRYGGLHTINDLTAKSGSHTVPSSGNIAFTTKGGIPISYERLYAAAYSKGLLQGANSIEDISDKVMDFSKLKSFVPEGVRKTGGAASEKVRAASEIREHYVKLAHFADVLKKSPGSNVDDVLSKAAQRVRKWHPDGLDLTPFEKNYARRMMPFYSWSRKAIPLIVESTVAHPAKALAYPRMMNMIQNATGVPNNGPGDPFPTDQLFPDWMKEKGIGPVAFHGMGGLPGLLTNLTGSSTNPDGSDGGYSIANPSNPLIDTVAQFAGNGKGSDVVQGIMSMVNPAFRIPAEVGTGHTALGTPINYDPAGYTAQQIPFLSYLASMGNVTPFGSTARGAKNGYPNWENIINFLTALGVKGSGPYIKQAEFEAKDRAKEAAQG